MLKKVSKIAVLFCMFAFAGNAFAQNEVPEYPQYGFWSNWGIGITGSFMYQPDVNQFYGIQNPYWGGGFNAGLGVLLQKEVFVYLLAHSMLPLLTAPLSRQISQSSHTFP